MARWTGHPLSDFSVPGTSDGTVWAAQLAGNLKLGSRWLFLDLTTGEVSEVPGITDPKDPCSPPNFTSDRTRLAHSDYRPERTGRVYEKKAAGWVKIAEVPGEKACLSPDGKLVATIAWPKGAKGVVVRVYSVAEGKELWSAPVDSYGLHGFTPDGRYVVQIDNAGHRLLDAATGKQAALVTNGPRRNSQGPLEVAYRAGWVAALVRGDAKAELVRWDLAKGVEASRTAVESPSGRNNTPPFGSPRLVVVGAHETHKVPDRPNVTWSSLTVDVFDPASADPVGRLRVANADSLVASPDGETLAAHEWGGLAFYGLPKLK
ncbi:hypothetical protein [Gemmata sp.]|uniref:hypothetical protein n=1 Tax=Gemmata sp. TaxID=1914242 RepID=UPI003F6ED372